MSIVEEDNQSSVFINIQCMSSSSGNVRAISQSYAEGEELAAGTVVVVHEKLTAGVSAETHAAAIKTMRSCQVEIV